MGTSKSIWAALIAFVGGVVLLTMALGLGGCNQVQVTADIAAAIDQQAGAAVLTMRQVDANELTPQDAATMLSANAAIMSGWAATATTNLFDYWFGKKKILADQDHYEDLVKMAAKFESAVERAQARPLDAPYYARREAVDFRKVKAAKDGTQSP